MSDKNRVWADDDPRRRSDEASDQDAQAAERVARSDEETPSPTEPDIEESALDPGEFHTRDEEEQLAEQVQEDQKQIEHIGDETAAREEKEARANQPPAADRYVMAEGDTEADRYADAEIAESTESEASLDVNPLGERNQEDTADNLDGGALGPTSDDLVEDAPDMTERAGGQAESRAAGVESNAPGHAATTVGAPPAPARAGAHRSTRTQRSLGQIAEHDSDNWWRAWLARTTAVLAGVLVLATGLAWAWVGGLHSPTPRDVPVAVINGDVGANAVINAVRQNGDTLKAVTYANAQDAGNALAKRKVDAILSSDSTVPGGAFNLSVASGAGPGVADTVATAVNSVATAVSVPLAVEDLHPVSTGDPRGLTPFYLMMAWILGGLVAAIALGVAIGTVPRDLDRLGMRLGALAAFSLLLGLLGALFAGPFLGVWHKHTVGLWLTGALVTFTAALIASALASWLGLWGAGIAVVLLLVLGVPGSGGIAPWDFLPSFFRGMPGWLPNGSSVSLIRGLEYFGRSANTWPIVGLTLWSLGSVLALLGATALLGRRARLAARG